MCFSGIGECIWLQSRVHNAKTLRVLLSRPFVEIDIYGRGVCGTLSPIHVHVLMPYTPLDQITSDHLFDKNKIFCDKLSSTIFRFLCYTPRCIQDATINVGSWLGQISLLRVTWLFVSLFVCSFFQSCLFACLFFNLFFVCLFVCFNFSWSFCV